MDTRQLFISVKMIKRRVVFYVFTDVSVELNTTIAMVELSG
jgi:hypothetical protein